jgi:NHL repeat
MCERSPEFLRKTREKKRPPQGIAIIKPSLSQASTVKTPLKRPDLVAPQRLPLAETGASVIVGASFAPDQLVIPVTPTRKTLFAPRGVCLAGGMLWVADTGHHRLLAWHSLPIEDGQPADIIIGQSDFTSEGQNAKGTPDATTLSVPTGICVCGEGLAVADAWNHRVLIWKQIPRQSNTPADIVLGQANFREIELNRGFSETRGDRLYWPFGVLYHEGKLLVADTGNRRVLLWNELPTENGQSADLVFGQKDLNSRDENGGDSPTASSFRWGHSLTVWRGHLAIVDAGNNRVMVWKGIPSENNQPCDFLLGQTDFSRSDINHGNYYPNAGSLNLPYGITTVNEWLLIADTANSRLLGWRYGENLHGATADGLAGQQDFQSKGENRSYGVAQRDSLCWPYCVHGVGNTVAIADSGNNRVLLWKWQES